jgi:hypothetical protein
MAKTSKIPAPDEIWSQFELGGLTKLVSVLAVFAYATGVIAINTYLHEVGIVDFSFAKPKLLLTGILVLVTILLFGFPSFLLAWSIATDHGQVGRRLPSFGQLLVLASGSFLLLLISSAFSCFQTHPGMGQSLVWEVWRYMKPGDGKWRRFLTSLLVALWVYLPILCAAISVYVVTRLFDQERSEQPTPQISLRRFWLALATAGFVVSTFVYIYMFSITFYSVIPQEFGGGKPYFQRFAVTKEYLCQLRQLGIPFASGLPNITQPLPVLHETETLVAVWLNPALPSHGNKGAGASSSDGKEDPQSWHFVVAELDKNQISTIVVVDNSVGTKSGIPEPPHLSPPSCTSDPN